jgi:hypothetical protein
MALVVGEIGGCGEPKNPSERVFSNSGMSLEFPGIVQTK